MVETEDMQAFLTKEPGSSQRIFDLQQICSQHSTSHAAESILVFCGWSRQKRFEEGTASLTLSQLPKKWTTLYCWKEIYIIVYILVRYEHLRLCIFGPRDLIVKVPLYFEIIFFRVKWLDLKTTAMGHGILCLRVLYYHRRRL